MEEKFNVFSTLADTTVFSGTKAECEDYKKKHENNDNSLYILSAKRYTIENYSLMLRLFRL